MITEKRAYESIAEEKARSLAETVSHSVAHGSEGFCPTCGHAGFYDLKGLGVSGASIFYSTTEGKWRCMSCELDAFGC